MKNIRKAIYLLLALSLHQAVMAQENRTYFVVDDLGSPVLATDDNGNEVWSESYTPYGNRHVSSAAGAGNSRWFTGAPQDNTSGLINLGARHYDPSIGRFLSIDPANINPADAFTINRYAYANNNPYSYIDPDGREVWGVSFGGSYTTKKRRVFGLSLTLALDTNGTFAVVTTPEYGLGTTGGSGFARGLFGFGDNTVEDLSGPGGSISGNVAKLSGSVTLPVSQIDLLDPTNPEDWFKDVEVGPPIVELGRAFGEKSASVTVGTGVEIYRNTLLGDTGRWWGNKIYEWTHDEYDPNQ